ncbi:MAG: hypothetical protein HY682_02480 [Chloroflexi bacterium]|nr:hypothetical protein [Chloroflexota bacterium]
MMEETTRNLDLDLAELICIESCLAPSQAGKSGVDAAGPSPSRETCLKIGAAILESLSTQQPIGLSLTEDELWILRERVSVYTSQGASTDLGLVLKSKVYQALLSIDNTRAADTVLGDLGTADEDVDSGMTREEVDDAIRRWQRNGNRRRSEPGRRTGTNNADSGPEDEAGTKTPSKP